MNRSRIALVLVVVALVVAGALFSRTRERADSGSVDDILNVDQVAKNPAAFADREVRLMGVVSAVLPEQQLFAVIDHAEYAACKVVTCSQFQIPIAYAGNLPTVEAAVMVTGRLTQSEPGRYLFQATTLELPK